MKHFKILSQLVLILLLWSLSLTGCSNSKNEIEDKEPTEHPPVVIETPVTPEKEISEAPTIISKDWSNYFDGLNGAAVFYDPSQYQYEIYNQELASIQRSPCSTFKIISSVIGLENGVIPSDNSTRKWSGEIFWKDDWNKDINFNEAFRVSCIWYFREVINELGADTIQRDLDKMQYGNRDISDWQGSLNTNNNNPVLTGFWVESSLKISAKEQVEVLERIFEGTIEYRPETISQLKKAMLIEDQNLSNYAVYGKTGLGEKDNVVVDSWFTGFVDTTEGNIYFCVYLGKTDGAEVSSVIAKEIALEIISDYLKNH